MASTMILMILVSALAFVRSDKVCSNTTSFSRVLPLDNYSVLETPYNVQQVQDTVNCGRLCADDDQCLMLRYHDGECESFKISPLSPNAALPGAGYYTKDGDPCPVSSDYTSVSSPRLCYKLLKVGDGSGILNWSESQSQCQIAGGRLIVLNTAEKQQFITSFLDREFNDAYYSVWVGMEYKDNVYVWTDGSTFMYGWVAGEPDQSSSQLCGKIIPTGLSDVECWDTNRYVCEIPL